jgi:hypothetical protein
MQSIIKIQLRLAMLASCFLAGCHTVQTPITREAVVGSYVYKSEDPEDKKTDHELDHLVLQSDGKYDLVQGGSTKPRSEKIGTWMLWAGGSDGPHVLLDHAGYPVEMKGDEIRLLIDIDAGIWYAKIR